MITLSPNNVSHVLCLGAHADDIEIGCGGTILSWLRENPQLHVTWVVWSSTPDRVREAQLSAEAFLGSCAERSIEICQFRDAYFPANWSAIKRSFEELANRVTPQVVLTHRLEDRHQDHRIVSELTWNTFRNHLILEYEIPKYEGDLGQPNCYLPISADDAQLKTDYLMSFFASQRSKDWFTPSTFEAMLRLRGLECRSPSGLAEAFTCRKLQLGIASF